jgi:hypothetical protein
MKNNNITRRDVMGCTAKVAGTFLALPYLSARDSFANAATCSTPENDIHSQLNPTRVNEVLKPPSAEHSVRFTTGAYTPPGRKASCNGRPAIQHARGAPLT